MVYVPNDGCIVVSMVGVVWMVYSIGMVKVIMLILAFVGMVMGILVSGVC